MTYELLEQIKSLLRSHLADAAAYHNRENLVMEPGVYVGSLPLSPENVFPYVLIKLPEGQDDHESAQVQVDIVCAVFAQEIQAGTQTLANLVDRCRLALLSFGAAEQRWSLARPITWRLGNDSEQGQPLPYHLATLTTHWRSGPLQQVPEAHQEVSYV